VYASVSDTAAKSNALAFNQDFVLGSEDLTIEIPIQ